MKGDKVVESEDSLDLFKLSEFRGWILFYLIVTTLVMVIAIVIGIGVLKLLNFSLLPKESILAVLDLVLIIFQIYSLVLILKKKKKAIIFNIITLWSFFVLSLFSGNLISPIMGFMWAVIWTIYFNTVEAKKILIN